MAFFENSNMVDDLAPAAKESAPRTLQTGASLITGGADKAEPKRSTYFDNSDMVVDAAPASSTPAPSTTAPLTPVPSTQPATGLYEKPVPDGVELAIPADVLAERDANSPYSGGGRMEAVHELHAWQIEELPADLSDADRKRAQEINAAYVGEWSKTAAAIGFTDDGMRFAVQAGDANLQLAERGELTADVILSQRAESERLLREQFGAEWETAVAAARALVKRDPRVKTQLDRLALNDHPSCVLPIAAQAMARYRAGRLKLPK